MKKAELKKQVCRVIDKWGEFIYDIEIWIKGKDPGNIQRIYRYNSEGNIPEVKNDKNKKT